MNIDFTGKVALVTGSSRGIGKTIAQAFFDAGASVMLTARNEQLLAEVAQEMGGDSGRVNYVAMDMQDGESIQKGVEKTVEVFGKLDFAVNNAGISLPHCPFHELEEAQYDELMNINMRGVFLGMKHQLRAMLKNENGGSIVNISSATAAHGIPMIAPYIASKLGVIGMTRSAAAEYATQKIRINAVVPGIVKTDLFDQGPGSTPEILAQVLMGVPMKRVGETDEVSGGVLYLCSDYATYVTGVALPIDGGFVL